MRATVDAKAFSDALDKVSKVLRKSKLPILKEAMVCFSGGRCVLTGTDFNTWLMTEIPAQGDDFAFVFHRTADAAKACRRFDGELTLELTETGTGRDKQLRLCVSCGHRSGELHAFFPEEYPERPKLEPEYSFTANAAALLGRINRIKYATYKPREDWKTMGTAIQFSGSRIYCLDGLRAAWDSDDTLSVPVPFMIPVIPLAHLKLFGKQDVSVRLGERHVEFTDGTLRLWVQREMEELFNLDSSIPSQFQEVVSFCPDEFLTELIYLKELSPNVSKLNVRFCGGRLLTGADGCRYQTRIQLDGRSEMEIGFNLHHMIDALRQFKGESCVRMKLTSPGLPIILEAEGRNDYALVLPIRPKFIPAAA